MFIGGPPLRPRPRRRRRIVRRSFGVVLIGSLAAVAVTGQIGTIARFVTDRGNAALKAVRDEAPAGGGELDGVSASLRNGGTNPAPGLGEAKTPLASPPPVKHVSDSHTYLATQPNGVTPVTWDPCRSIHYVTRTAGAPAGGAQALAAAIDRVSAATGLQFVDDGPTDEAPDPQRAPFQPTRYGDRWAPVLIAWSTPQESPALDGKVVGIGGPITERSTGHPDVHVSGSVTLDAPALAEILSAKGGGKLARAIVMHELGHLVGLGHVDDATQIMNPEADPDVTRFGAGDLTGLAALGAGPCAPWV